MQPIENSSLLHFEVEYGDKSIDQVYDDIRKKFHNHFLTQVKLNCHQEIKELERYIPILPNPIQNDLKELISYFNLSDNLLPNSCIVQLHSLIKKVSLSCQEYLEEHSQFRNLHIKNTTARINQLCIVMHTSIQSRCIHALALKFFCTIPAIASSETDKIVDHIPKFRRGGLIYRLASIWVHTAQSAKSVTSSHIYNLPNFMFDVQTCHPNSLIRVHRMRSPDNLPSEKSLNHLYHKMLGGYSSKDLRHMDFCLVRLSEWKTERKVAKLRLNISNDHPENLISWAFDPYADFSRQNATSQVRSSEFMEQLLNYVLDPSHKVFVLPETPQAVPFRAKLIQLMNHIHEDIFITQSGKPKLYLDEVDRQDFIHLLSIYLMEYYVEKYQPDSLSTPCRSHIDRGMLISTVFYTFLLIKSEQYTDQEMIEYLEQLIFPPSLLFAKRPTHKERIKCLLSILSRLSNEQVIYNLKNRQSFFSGCQVRIPD